MDPFRINEDALIKPSLLENDPVFLEKKNFTIYVINAFSLFRLNLPLEKGATLSLSKLYLRMLCAKFG